MQFALIVHLFMINIQAVVQLLLITLLTVSHGDSYTVILNTVERVEWSRDVESLSYFDIR